MPQLLDKQKPGGRELPTEVYIRKKRESSAISYMMDRKVLCSSGFLQAETDA